jgi:UMF1 family MFS transporter
MTTAPIADLFAFERRKEHRSWYWYDWANSAYVTTIGTVLFAPYLTSVAERAACGRVGTDENPCKQDLSVLG